MDKKVKILILIFILGIFYTVTATYYRFYILRDYYITAEIECDPQINSCFVWEEDDEIFYYSLIKKKAKNIPFCNPHREECEELTCEEGERKCQITFCEIDKLEEGEECAEPGFIEDNLF